MQLIERMRHNLSNINSVDRTFHHFLLFHLLHSMTFGVSPTHIQMMRRSSRDEQRIGMRAWRDTVKDRCQRIPLATPPLLTIRAVHVLTLTMMMVIVVPGLLQEVMILIERTSREMTSRC